MEKSHHVAKSSSQAHSQHGGTKHRTSVVVQDYEFWYRNIEHRYDAKLKKRIANAEHGLPDPEVLAVESRPRDAWHASNAATACGAWRAGRTREGRRYVALNVGGQQQGSAEEEPSPGSCDSPSGDEEPAPGSQCPQGTQESTQSDYSFTDIT